MANRSRLMQAWTIARIELKRAFFSKRAFWVYGLALLPAIIFFFYGVQMKFRLQMLSRNKIANPALLDTIRTGETPEAVIQRIGKPSSDHTWVGQRAVRDGRQKTGVTTHKIEPSIEAQFVRLSIMVPAMGGDRSTSRIYEFEVYGKDDTTNLALNRPATGSDPCTPEEGPEKAVNGSVSGGTRDRWCSHKRQAFLQVDLGKAQEIRRIVVKHASAGGEPQEFDTAFFNIQASSDNKYFTTIVNVAGARFVNEVNTHRRLVFFDGNRRATLNFKDNKLESTTINRFIDFEENRLVFAGIFQFFYLRLAIFFGCLGIFMNLFRGEMLDKTLHYWFLAPARREVLLAGKYGAGLIASAVIFAGGALLCFGLMLSLHSPAEVQAYWETAGLAHAFWYAVAAVLGCVGYGSVFLAAGLLLRNPIIPAGVLLGWEAINGFLPQILQKLSVLYYLQSLCPVPAPVDKDMPALIRLLLTPASPASRAGAVLGIIVLTGLVLWAACSAIRRMELNYTTE